MRALWIAGSAAVLASCLAASASANPIRLRPSWHVQSIQRNASGDCGSLPSGTGILRDGDFSQAPNPGNDTGVGPDAGAHLQRTMAATARSAIFADALLGAIRARCEELRTVAK